MQDEKQKVICHECYCMQRAGRIRKDILSRLDRQDGPKLVGLGRPMLDPLKAVYSRICVSFQLCTIGRHWGFV